MVNVGGLRCDSWWAVLDDCKVTHSSAEDLTAARAEVKFWQAFIAAERDRLDEQAIARCQEACELARQRLTRLSSGSGESQISRCGGSMDQ